MLYKPILSFLQILLAAPSSREATSRVVAAESILDDKKRQSGVFPLQRLEGNPAFQGLEQRDRSFARALVTTTERRKGQIDILIGKCRDRKPRSIKKDDLLVEATLRLGIAQMLFMDVPLHAAVKETVDILRSIPSTKVPESKIKFVNAILRRVSREGDEMLDKYTVPADNIAPWLLQQWKSDWGKETAHEMAEASMNQSPVHLSVKYPADQSARNARQEQVRDAIGGDILPNGSIQVSDEVGGMVKDWPLYEEGLWWVQDASASLPALALYNVLQQMKDVQDLHVADICAAPGGKTAQLASLGFGTVTAIEFSSKRTRRLKQNLNRLDMMDQCSIVVADGTEWTAPDDQKVDGVLLDVPCSATGTGSKRPDVLQRSKDMTELLETQEQLANHCADNILQPGGIMVYATCSTLKKESEEQVQKLLARSNGAKMETVPIQPGEIPGFDPAIDENGWLRVLPGSLLDTIGSCDGFFVARLRRVS